MTIFDPPPDTLLIYPAIKRTAAWVAGLAALLIMTSAGTALLELTLGFAGFISPALLAGATSHLCLQLHLVCLGLLAPWCLQVLVAGRGGDVTRWLAWFCAILALLILTCTVYSTLTFERLMIRQDSLPPLLLILLTCITAVNLPRMAAASLPRRAALTAAPILLLAADITDLPGLLPLCTAAKLLAAALLAPQLLQLRHTATRILTMPDLINEEPPCKPGK